MKDKFKYILTEVAVIVIGLLIAFQIDRWYESHKENEIERKILKEIRTSLLLDITELNFNAERHEKAFVFHDSVMNKLRLQEYDTLTPIFLDYIFRDLTFTPSLSNYESLKNLGYNLLKNDSLRMKLIDLYEFEYGFLVKLEEVYRQGQHFDKYYQVVHNNFDKWEYVFDKEGRRINLLSRPKNFSRLKNDPELQVLLNMTRYQHKFTLGYYELTRKKLQTVVDLIDKELEGD